MGMGTGPVARSRGRRATRLVAVAALLLGGTAYLTGDAEAVHDEGFALQGDVDHGSMLDWVDLFDVAGTAQPTAKATLPGDFIRASFDQDFQEPDTSAYATGSKDTLPINVAGAGDWQCKRSNNIGDKFNLINAYAAALRPSTNAGGAEDDLIVYFGSEIAAPEGNRNAGLWLLQDETVDCSTTAGGNQNWTGHHTDGDVFIVSAFTNGGTRANITVYEWVDTVGAPDDDIGGSLQLRFGVPDNTSPNDFLCETDGDPQAHDDVACAITNSTATVNPPWEAPDKSGGDLDIHTFLEGAVNLSQLGLDACFSTAVHNSRSSQEAGSTLHDFSRMQFETCGNMSVHKYIDADMSGTNNGDDPGPGYSFLVENSAGDDICSGTTDADGDLVCTTGTLENLPTGQYTITETQQSGFFNTDPGEDGDPTTTPNVNGAATVSKTVTVSFGDTHVEFGNTCYVDKTFRITNVPTGAAAPTSITVSYRVNDGLPQTLALAATAGNASVWTGTVADTLLQTDSIDWSWYINGDTVNTAAGATDEELSAGAHPACAVTNTAQFTLATLDGTKYKDADADGTRDPGEPGLGGWTFTLTRTSDSAVVATTTSASDGTYSFTNVPPGSYTVTETGQTGWEQTAPASGSASVTVVLGDTSETIAAFGNTPLSTISVTFNPLTAYTEATSISCVDSAGASVGSNTGSNSLTTGNVDVSQSSVVCTITYVDP